MTPNEPEKSERTRSAIADFVICGALIVLVALVFAQASLFPFINYDDDQYVYDNPVVAGGLSPSSVAWAFTTFHFASWHPLTWLSHLTDVTLFGMTPGFHHLVNVLFHLANSLLLYFALFRLTAARWPSVCVAALFAIHPLHVEPVVWVASRKDVLSTFFWLLAIIAYTAYARRGGTLRYLCVVAATTAALLSKTMAITLPFTLLLLDVWPLARLDVRSALSWRRSVLEKIPLLLLAAAAACLTYFAQLQGEALMTSEEASLGLRLENVVVSYGLYLYKTVWPVDLAPFYPYPKDGIPLTSLLAAGAVLTALSVGAWALRRKVPAVLIGWLWFVGTLIPVIGLVQTGSHAMADRFTYVPHIGLFIAIVWGVFAFIPQASRKYVAVAATIACFALTWIAGAQVQRWRNPVVLFQHSIDVAGPTVRMLNNMGNAYLTHNQAEEAIPCFTEALRIKPDAKDIRTNLGAAYLILNRPYEAVPVLEAAVAENPDNPVSLTNYAYALALVGRGEEALTIANRAAAIQPPHPQAANLLQALQANRIKPVPPPATPETTP